MSSLTVSYAPEAWKLLNGIFTVYKPSGLSAGDVRRLLKKNLCKGLNELAKREPRSLVYLKGSVCTNKPYEVGVIPNYADHELVSGPRYQEHDIRVSHIHTLGYNTSGVFLMTVNDGCKHAYNPAYKTFLRKYEIKGKFGIATKNFMLDGIVFEGSTYHHIKQNSIDKMLADIQTSHQALAYKYAGIDPRSQEGYEAAASGLIKPPGLADTGPIIYSIKCTEFKLPHFTLEVHCVNEREEFFAELIHDIGVDLRSTAVCTQLRRVQYGHFNLSHALLRKHWNLEHILNNISLSRRILSQDSTSDYRTVKQLVQKDLIEDVQKAAREELI